DEVGPAVPGSELFQVNRSGDPHRKGYQKADKQGVKGADDSAGEAGKLGKTAVGIEEERPVERCRDEAALLQALEQLDVHIGDATPVLGKVSIDHTFVKLVERVGSGHF